jgi:hypothetical protein
VVAAARGKPKAENIARWRLMTEMFRPAEEALKTLANIPFTVMAGLDQAIQLSN